MQTRLTALEGFYHASPIWQAHRTVANDTISDVSNVFLLRSARVTAGFCFDPANRPMRGTPELAGGGIIATIHSFTYPVDPPFLNFLQNHKTPPLRKARPTPFGPSLAQPNQ